MFHPFPSPSDVFRTKNAQLLWLNEMVESVFGRRESREFKKRWWHSYQWDAIFTKIKVFMKIFCRDIDKLIRLMNLKATPGWFEGPLKLSAEKYKPQEELLMINDTQLKQLLWKGEWQKTLFNYRCKILGFKAGNNRNTQRTQGWDVMFSSIHTTYHWHTWHSCD